MEGKEGWRHQEEQTTGGQGAFRMNISDFTKKIVLFRCMTLLQITARVLDNCGIR
jgi:hypothetical protein